MAGKYRRYYIGTGTTLLTIFIALQMYGLQITDLTGDINCTVECTSYFDVKNPTYRSIYIYNKDNVSIDFSPDIKDYKLYVKYYGKWRHMNFTMESRLPNVPKSRIYVFVFPRYSTKHFKLVGTKEATQTVKWGFGFDDNYLDPIWIGDSSKPTDCKGIITYWNQTEWYSTNETICPTVWKNRSCYINDTWYNKKVLKNKTECVKEGFVYYADGTKIGGCNDGNCYYCDLKDNNICCVLEKGQGLTGGEGGQYGDCRIERTSWNENLETKEKTFYDSANVEQKPININQVISI